jgi:hypothetical protein
MAEDEEVLEFSMNVLIESSYEAGPTSKTIDYLKDILITMGTENPKYVSKHIVTKILSIIENELSDINDQTDLSNNKPWQKLVVLLRILMVLSFQNRLNVADNLPYLLHFIIVMLGKIKNKKKGKGDSMTRSTLYALCANVFHSLTIEFDVADKEESKTELKSASSSIISKKFQNIFMGNSSITPQPFKEFDALNNKKETFESITIKNIEYMINFFFGLINLYEDLSGKNIF